MSEIAPDDKYGVHVLQEELSEYEVFGCHQWYQL